MSNGALFKDPVIKKIAEAHGKSPAQIILRWHIQEGFSVIPGVSNPDYIKENIQIFDIVLTDEEMRRYARSTRRNASSTPRWRM